MNLQATARPCFVSTERANTGKDYVVRTRRESGLKALPDLRGKEMVALDSANANLGRPWMETLLREHQLGTPETFFGGLEIIKISRQLTIEIIDKRPILSFYNYFLILLKTLFK